jgi:DNA-binding CsgD family transcriptional regulator
LPRSHFKAQESPFSESNHSPGKPKIKDSSPRCACFSGEFEGEGRFLKINLEITYNSPYIHARMNDNQKKIVEMVANGLTAQQIGDTLKISRRTVEKHLQIIKYIYDAKNTPHLVHIAHVKKLI